MEKKFNQDYVVGIDLGTGSCKTIIMGINGQILGFASSNYEAHNHNSQWIEQDPESLYKGLMTSFIKAVKGSKTQPEKCLGISVGGALHSLIAIDSNHLPLTGVITWADMRARKQSEELSTPFNLHNFYALSGCPNNPMYPLSKIIWLQEKEPELYRNVYKFITAKEYVLWRLTGKEIVDYALASGSGLFNIQSLVWDSEILSLAGIRSSMLSAPADPLTRIGFLDDALKDKADLAGSIPIFLGSADAVNSSLGAGTTGMDSLTCMIGTSGAIRTITGRPLLDDKQRLWCYAIDGQHWLSGGAINNGGMALDWLREILNTAAPGSKEIDFNEISEWVSQVPPGSDGLVCLPFLTYERSPNWNPRMRAVLAGLTLQHSYQHIARSFLEGISFRLKSILEVIQEVTGREDYVINASGGFTKSGIWVKILADILNQNLVIPATGETSAVGAAFWVLLASKVVDNIGELKQFVNIVETHSPDAGLNEVYTRTFKMYQELYDANSKVFNHYY